MTTTIQTAAPDEQVRSVTDYYRHVDAGEVSSLVSLFTDEAVYYRPGYTPLRGHAELRTFYDSERVIESGRHELAQIIRADRTIAVYGTFTGVLKSGTAVTVGFADFFTLDDHGRFAERRTFFDKPAV